MQRISKSHVYLWGIVLSAVLLRVVGILHDLPYSYFGDEEHFIKRALAFGSGDLNPHWFHKPAFYMYLLFGEYGLFFVFGYLAGWFETVDAFAKYYFTDQTYFLVLGRLTTALFSCGMVYLTYLLGKRFWGEKVGLIAAIFLACTPGNFESSIVVKADIPAAFFGLLFLYFSLLVLERGHLRHYVFAGLFLGLGAATKYYPVAVLPCVWVAHFLRSKSERVPLVRSVMGPQLYLALACFCAAFFIGSPYTFLDPASPFGNVYRSFIVPLSVTEYDEDGSITKEGGGIRDKIESIIYSVYLIGRVVQEDKGMGVPLGILAMGGLGYWAFRFFRLDYKVGIALVYVCSFVLLAAVFSPANMSSRYLNLIYPVLCLAGAHFICEVFSVIGSKFSMARLHDVTLSLCCFAIALPGLFQIVAYDYLVIHKDTRLLAKEWIEGHIPGRTKVVVDAKGPRLHLSQQNLQELLRRSQAYSQPGPFTTHLEKYYTYQLAAVSAPTYDITKISHPWWLVQEHKAGTYRLQSAKDVDMGNPVKDRGVMPLASYKEQGYRYVITDSHDYDKYFRAAGRLRFPSFYQFYRDLFSTGQLVKEFRPDPWNRPGPTVKIFQLQ